MTHEKLNEILVISRYPDKIETTEDECPLCHVPFSYWFQKYPFGKYCYHCSDYNSGTIVYQKKEQKVKYRNRIIIFLRKIFNLPEEK